MENTKHLNVFNCAEVFAFVNVKYEPSVLQLKLLCATIYRHFYFCKE